MRENRDESFVLFMTALSSQHQEMRTVSTLGTALFNHLATEQHIENARNNIHTEDGHLLLSKIQTLDLSDFKGQLTEEIVQIIQSMTTLKTLKLSGTELRRLILSHPSLLELQVEDCKLVDLDVSGCNELLILNASRNSLKTVVGITEKCKMLILDGNEISSNRCLRSAKGLEILSIKNSRGRLRALNLFQMKKLRELDVSSNRGLKTVVVHESLPKETMRMALKK